MRKGVELWDVTFSMPFHIFRRELKRIASQNLSALDGVSCVPIEDVPVGQLAVPVDDDDWFSPELAQALTRMPDDFSGYFWPRRFLEVPTTLRHELGLFQRSLFPATAPRFLCSTNNYVVRWSAGVDELLLDHTAATRWFLANPSHVTQLERPLSLMNRSLASTTQLRYKPSRSKLLRKYRRYHRLYRKPPVQDMLWCTPYLAKMRDLHDELRPVGKRKY